MALPEIRRSGRTERYGAGETGVTGSLEGVLTIQTAVMNRNVVEEPT